MSRERITVTIDWKSEPDSYRTWYEFRLRVAANIIVRPNGTLAMGDLWVLEEIESVVVYLCGCSYGQPLSTVYDPQRATDWIRDRLWYAMNCRFGEVRELILAAAREQLAFAEDSAATLSQPGMSR